MIHTIRKVAKAIASREAAMKQLCKRIWHNAGEWLCNRLGSMSFQEFDGIANTRLNAERKARF
jgi:hypothetical protein